MTNAELKRKIEERIRTERRVTTEILELIHLAMDRKIYLPLGYASMFQWLTKGFGYSESAAYRRIESARVLRSLPQIKEKLVGGVVTLSSLTKANAVFRAQEKQSKRKITTGQREHALAQIEKKSVAAAEKILLSIFPEAASKMKSEIRTAVDENVTRITINLDDQVLRNLDRIRDLLAAAIPNADLAQVIERIANDYLDRKDPLRQIPSRNKNSAYLRVN